MKKSIDVYEEQLETIRVGRASAAVLNGITVDYYGMDTPINQMAEVKVSDAKTLMILPWDASTLKNIEKAILASSLGITPQNDGKTLRLNFPPLTEERRKQLAKPCKEVAEHAKISIRNARRDGIDILKKSVKDGTPEDVAKDGEAAEHRELLLTTFANGMSSAISSPSVEMYRSAISLNVMSSSSSGVISFHSLSRSARIGSPRMSNIAGVPSPSTVA